MSSDSRNYDQQLASTRLRGSLFCLSMLDWYKRWQQHSASSSSILQNRCLTRAQVLFCWFLSCRSESASLQYLQYLRTWVEEEKDISIGYQRSRRPLQDFLQGRHLSLDVLYLEDCRGVGKKGGSSDRGSDEQKRLDSYSVATALGPTEELDLMERDCAGPNADNSIYYILERLTTEAFITSYKEQATLSRQALWKSSGSSKPERKGGSKGAKPY